MTTWSVFVNPVTYNYSPQYLKWPIHGNTSILILIACLSYSLSLSIVDCISPSYQEGLHYLADMMGSYIQHSPFVKYYKLTISNHTPLILPFVHINKYLTACLDGPR